MALAAHRWTTTAPDAPRARAASRAGTPPPGGINPVFEAVHPRAITRRTVLVP